MQKLNSKDSKHFKTMDREIIWNIVNSLLAGALVFVGACASGGINEKGVAAAAAASAIVALTKFYDYWQKEEEEYRTERKIGAFNFL